MDREQLKIEFENLKDSFDMISERINAQVVETKYSKGEYFEIIPYSYQRNGFSQGKILENPKKSRTTKNLYIYGFDDRGKLMEIREGISIENQFYYQFLLHEKDFTKSLSFDNSKSLRNVSICIYDESGKLCRLSAHAKRGGSEETYFYTKDGKLDYVLVKQIDRHGNEVNPYKEQFEYDENGDLKRISKNFDNGFSRQTFPADEIEPTMQGK